MGKIPHYFEHGCWYFVTSTTIDFQPVFTDVSLAAIFLDVLESLCRRNLTRIDEFVLMPEHFHVIMIPETRALPEVIRDLKRGSARLINRLQNVKGRSIWAENYRDDKIFDERELESKRNYIWLNPVKRQLVNTPGEYPYSSASIEMRKRFGLSLG